MNGKEENVVLDSHAPAEENHPPNLRMKIKTEDTTHITDERGNEMNIKEDVLDFGLQNVDSFSSLETNRNPSEEHGMFLNIDIKGEPWWPEAASPGTKCHPEASSVSQLEMLDEIQDDTNEDLPVAEAARLHGQTTSSISTAVASLFTAEDLEETHTRKPPAVEQTYYYHKSGALKHKHSEKLDERINSTDDIFQKSISQEDNGKTSALVHEVKRPYKCDVCKKCFTQSGSLGRHILIHEGKRPYKCNVCEKAFTQLETLRNHSLIHNGRRPYKCNSCEKSFTRVGHLKSHILVHEGRSPYKCDICEKSFTRMEHLKSHILIHEGKRPHKCDLCEKSFTQMSSLRKHILIHEGKRPYSCGVCEKAFTHRETLKNHSLIHEGKTPHKCDVCEKSFTQIGTLKRHILIHEGKRQV